MHLDPSRTQPLTSSLFTVHGFFGLVSAPIIAHFADKSPNRKIPLLIALAGCFVGTLMIALTHSRMSPSSLLTTTTMVSCADNIDSRNPFYWTRFPSNFGVSSMGGRLCCDVGYSSRS